MVKVVQSVSESARVVVNVVIAQQSGLCTIDGERLAENLAKVLQVIEQTEFTGAKWLKKTNPDPQLILLRSEVIDRKDKAIYLNYKLFEVEISIDIGLIFVSGKLPVPRTMKEWVPAEIVFRHRRWRSQPS